MFFVIFDQIIWNHDQKTQKRKAYLDILKILSWKKQNTIVGKISRFHPQVFRLSLALFIYINYCSENIVAMVVSNAGTLGSDRQGFKCNWWIWSSGHLQKVKELGSLTIRYFAEEFEEPRRIFVTLSSKNV